MNDGLERLRYEGRELAVVIRSSYHGEGITFFTPSDYSQQLGYMNRPAGHRIQPHLHKPVRRSVRTTLETLFVRSGRVRIEFFGDDRRRVAETVVAAGDVILLVAGGHALTMLEPSELIEVKQGPYAGDDDKKVFEPLVDEPL